jgi:hypothetical protein
VEKGMIVSTGFKSRILSNEGFLDIFGNGAIFIFSGARPASADLSDSTGTLLGVVTSAGLPWDFTYLANGLSFIHNGPYVLKDSSQNWVLNPTSSGTATWFRLYAPEADGNRGTSYALSRIDGDIQPVGSSTPAEMFMTSVDVVSGIQVTMDYFLYTIPPFAF